MVNIPHSKCKVSCKQLIEFERGRLIGRREGGLPSLIITPRTHRNAATVMCVCVKQIDRSELDKPKPQQWCTQYSVSSQVDRHFTCISVMEGRVTARVGTKLEHGCRYVVVCPRDSSMYTTLLLHARSPLYRNPMALNHRRLRLCLAHQHMYWRANWQQTNFSGETRCNVD